MVKIDLSNLPKITNDAFLPLYKNQTRFLVLKGGAGSGKSVYVGQKLVYRTLVEKDPRLPHRFLVIRKVSKTIRESCWMMIVTTIRKWGMSKLFKINKSDFTITCKLNGNQFIFCGIDDPEKIKSITDITGIWVEEASEIEKDDLDQLNLRLRGWTPFYKQIILSFNPISQGNYLRREFFVHTREDAFIHNSTYKDNKFLDEQYRQQLESYKERNPYYYQVYVLNDWGAAIGACFPEFRENCNIGRTWTHVIEPFDPLPEMKIYRSFDFGYSKPVSVGWWAQDYDGRFYRILELYGCTGEPNVGIMWHPQKIAEKIREIEDQHRYLKGKRIIGVADPSIWDVSRGESIASVMEKYRIYFEKGDNKRLPGKMQVHYRLSFDVNGIPMLYVFNHCKDFIRTFPELVYDEHDPEDVDSDGEDHIYDETRYLCQMNPIAPRKNLPAKATKYNPLDTEPPRNRYGFMKM
jgi:hypothetical protein